MNDAGWEKRYKDLKELFDDKRREHERLQQKFFQLESDVSNRNLDSKFTPIVAQHDIHDEDYARDDYPYFGKSRHTRRPADGNRTIRGQMLSETGYASEFSEDDAGSVNTNSLERQKREKTEREKVRVLENLKGQAVTLQKQIEGQRAQLNENIVMLDGNLDDKIHLVDAEIITQKNMLQQADDKMNEILERMTSDVQQLNGNTSEIDGLKQFLREQRQKQHEKLHAYTNDNEQLKIENHKMKNTLKQKDKNSKDEVNQLKAKLRKVERESRTTNQSKDKEAENAIHLAETQVRMALEEKFNEMWQPAEVLNRIASFIDSDFKNVGNDELTSALEHIRRTATDLGSDEIKVLRNQLNQAQRQLEHAAPRESTNSVDSPLRENLARHQGELKAAKNAQRRVEGEITRMRLVQKEAEEELEDLKLRIMERDGTILDNQKERNRLDQNGLQLKRENEANLAKIKQLTADLQAAQDERHNQAKLISRLRSQIEEIKNEKQDAERFRDQLEADLVKFEQEANDRLRQLQSQSNKLNREQEKNAQLEEERDSLLQQFDQLERELASVKKSQLEKNDAQEQIKQLKKMVRELKNAESDTKAAHILLQFNDRFDEVLSAISNTEKRLDTGAKSRSKRMLDAIDELSHLLLDDNSHNMHHNTLLKKLKSLKNQIKMAQDNDEFYFVPANAATGKFPNSLPVDLSPDEVDGIVDGTDDGKGKTKRKSRAQALVYAAPLYLPTHKKSRRYATSLAITSRPEKIAKAHTRAVMKALHEGYY